MKFPLLINMKMPTIVGIFIFISRENFMRSWVEHEKVLNLGAWSVFFCAWRNFACLCIKNALSEDSDQTVRMYRLSWIFAGCTCPKVCFWRCSLNINFLIYNYTRNTQVTAKTRCRRVSDFGCKLTQTWRDMVYLYPWLFLIYQFAEKKKFCIKWWKHEIHWINLNCELCPESKPVLKCRLRNV